MSTHRRQTPGTQRIRRAREYAIADNTPCVNNSTVSCQGIKTGDGKLVLIATDSVLQPQFLTGPASAG